ncbi:MAG: hypothetical protein EA341_09425 [Mongoliibacter sp.]|uniref:hypothetical protein n=1 Tax=Mongoliibacter sp. TaxID=2022438 RepID=UPI0012EF0822|nr:hypothetical protein [Mongoliibacter sp.]TVP49447.1 MAG: hypothetical protein EA341_09425 [Mongoliibacter sp.]
MSIQIIAVFFLSLSGLALAAFQFKNRERTEVKEGDALDHIKGMYILKVPYEKLVIAYFGLMAIASILDWILGGNPEKLNLTYFLVSSCAFLIFLYKLGMSFIKTVEFKWPTAAYILLNVGIAAIVYHFMTHPVLKMAEALEYILTFHLLGMILGLGGTLILDILIFHFLRNFKINSSEAVIMHLISQLIILGLVLLMVTGVAIYLTDMQAYNSNPRFLMKMTAVLILSINGVFLNFYMMPAIEKLSLVEEDIEEDQNLKRVAFSVGGVSMVSWLAAFAFAMVKDLSQFNYIQMLVPYLVLVIGAIGGGQFIKKKMEKEVIEESQK